MSDRQEGEIFPDLVEENISFLKSLSWYWS